ncbi:uncharacterized protein LOC144161010 [Haemaphysalis longicornis]
MSMEEDSSSRVSSLGLGQRSYDYIREFLTGRTAKIQAGDLQLEERELGSVGTPHGSVISPLLFNLVMIGGAYKLLSEVPQVRHSIYADDITLWVPVGSDGHIEDTLQAAINTIEDHLDGTGLVCSPQKWELLVIPPPGRNRKQALVGAEGITLRTRDGTVIPKVRVLTVLGMLLEASGGTTATVNRLTTKIGAASRLIKRVATRHWGMREASLLRLVQSFAISHVAYGGAFHVWKVQERERINAAIPKAYKAALGLLDCTSTARLFELGVPNSMEEIAEAQRPAQLVRLSTTRTGWNILARLGLDGRSAPSEAVMLRETEHALPSRTLRD